MHSFQKAFSYLFLSALGICFAIPFIWMISSSWKQSTEIFVLPPKWIPNPPVWENHVELFRVIPFLRFFWNSTYVTILATAGQVMSCALAACALSAAEILRQRRDILHFVGNHDGAWTSDDHPAVLDYAGSGLAQHPPALIRAVFLRWTFGTFMLRQFFFSIPRELDDAALIDGCSQFRAFGPFTYPFSRLL